MIDPELDGRTALVTGANNPVGIGAATARALAAQGARVFVTGYQSDTDGRREKSRTPGPERYRALQTRPVDHIVNELRESGAEAAGVDCDLSEPDTPKRLLDAAEDGLGASVSILVNNAAHWVADTFGPEDESGPIGADGAAAPFSAETHDRHFAINSRGPALLMREFARRHRERGADWGRIVNVSTDGASGFAGEVSYGASKHALESFSRAAAWELGRDGITVNVVAPGPVQTGWIPPEAEGRLREEIPRGRIGKPEDVADAIVFLASEQARWITGQLLYVGGGHVMPM